jgi:hypothetical protein
MKNLFLYNILLFLLVSCSTDSNFECSEPQSNSETLKTKPVPYYKRLKTFDNGQKYYDLLQLYFVSRYTLPDESARKDRDWEISVGS